MPFQHVLLTLLVVFVWGINFLFLKIALVEISPLLLCTLRFLLSSIPAIFFIKLPKDSIKTIALYGLIVFALQFSLIFIGMSLGMTAGLASLIAQTQVFFAMFFAGIFLGERSNIWQIVGALISFMGVAVVSLHFDNNSSFLGFICILSAAAVWGGGNLITKKSNKRISSLALIVWGSFFAFVPMIFICFIFEGLDSIRTSFENLTWHGTSAVFYTVYLSTWLGYGLWNWLINRYPVGMVVPFTLLVPVFGVISSVLFLGETFYLWKLVSSLLVISGVFINFLGGRRTTTRTLPDNQISTEQV